MGWRSQLSLRRFGVMLLLVGVSQVLGVTRVTPRTSAAEFMSAALAC